MVDFWLSNVNQQIHLDLSHQPLAKPIIFFCNCHLVNSTNEVELDWVGVIYRNSFPCPLEQAKKFTFLTAPNLSPGKAVTTHHLHNRHGYSTAWLIITSIVTTWCFSLGLHMEKFKTRNLSLLQKLQCCHNLVILKHTNKLIFFSSRTICSATREDRYAFRREGWFAGGFGSTGWIFLQILKPGDHGLLSMVYSWIIEQQIQWRAASGVNIQIAMDFLSNSCNDSLQAGSQPVLCRYLNLTRVWIWACVQV